MIFLVPDTPIETRADNEEVVIRSSLAFPTQVLGIVLLMQIPTFSRVGMIFI
jgi:hypothetical protein